MYLRTKFPEYYPEDKVFLLDFKGRVKKSSKRNF